MRHDIYIYIYIYIYVIRRLKVKGEILCGLSQQRSRVPVMRRRSYGAVTYTLDTASRTPCRCVTVNIPPVSSLGRLCDVTVQDGGSDSACK